MKKILFICVFAFMHLYSQVLDTVKTVEGIVDDFNKANSHFIQHVLLDGNNLELICTQRKNAYSPYDAYQAVIPANFEYPFRILVNLTDYKLKGIQYPDFKNLIKEKKISKSLYLRSEAMASVGYNFYYMITQAGGSSPAIMKVGLGANFEMMDVEVNPITEIEKFELVSEVHNENYYVFCVDRSSKGKDNFYTFLSTNHFFDERKIFEVKIPVSTAQIDIPVPFMNVVNNYLVVCTDERKAVYDLKGNSLVNTHSNINEYLQPTLIENDFWQTKIIENGVWHTFILRQSENTYGYNKIIVLRDDLSAEHGVGNLSLFSYELDSSVCSLYYPSQELQRFNASKKRHKGIYGLEFDTIIKKDDGSYFLILKNVIKTNFNLNTSYNPQTQNKGLHTMTQSNTVNESITYSTTTISEQYGPTILLHFSNDHKLLKFVVFTGWNKEIDPTNKYSYTHSNWVLTEDNIYGSTFVSESVEENNSKKTISKLLYVYKYNINDMMYSTTMYSCDWPGMRLYAVGNGVAVAKKFNYVGWEGVKFSPFSLKLIRN